MALDKYSLNKLYKKTETPRCPVCDKECHLSDVDDLEYVKTKRGTEIFIHTECAKKWSD